MEAWRMMEIGIIMDGIIEENSGISWDQYIGKYWDIIDIQ